LFGALHEVTCKMDLLTTKIITMLLFGGGSLLVGLVTYQFRKLLGSGTSKKKSKEVASSMLLCFGGGVLLSTALLHILPEVDEMLEEEQEKLGINFLAELILCAGFFLVYLLEELVHFFLRFVLHSSALHHHVAVRRPAQDADCCSIASNTRCHNVMERAASPDYAKVLGKEKDAEAGDDYSQESSENEFIKLGISDERSSIRDCFTVLGLSFHMIFEGLAVGLEESPADVWKMFTAISCHKFVITFCVALELLQNGISRLVFASFLVTFSLISPLGIGIGVAVSALGGEQDPVLIAVLQGLAGGTILYVVMFEVLNREKAKEISGLMQLFGIMIGFTAMLLLDAFVGEEHGCGGEAAAGAGALS